MSDQLNEQPGQNGGELIQRTNEPSVVAVRAAKEVEAAMLVAQRFPRDELGAIQKIKNACRRKGLAENAEYEYKRGGTAIVGASVDLLRAIKCHWGNISSGWQEIARQNGRSTVYVYAFDLENNARAEITFEIRHWRDTKQGGYALRDERDIYELIANAAARRERKCLQDIIPSDVVDAAVDECRKTLKGANTEPMADRLGKLLDAYSRFNVTKDMIEAYLGHDLSATSENRYAQLRRIWKSLQDGVAQVEDHFTPTPTAAPRSEASGGSKTERVAEDMKSKRAGGKGKQKELPEGAEDAPSPAPPSSEIQDDPRGAKRAMKSVMDRVCQGGEVEAINAAWQDLLSPDNPATEADVEWVRRYVAETYQVELQ